MCILSHERVKIVPQLRSVSVCMCGSNVWFVMQEIRAFGVCIINDRFPYPDSISIWVAGSVSFEDFLRFVAFLGSGSKKESKQELGEPLPVEVLCDLRDPKE